MGKPLLVYPIVSKKHAVFGSDTLKKALLSVYNGCPKEKNPQTEGP
jgi:hypothetical protein